MELIGKDLENLREQINKLETIKRLEEENKTIENEIEEDNNNELTE